MARSLIGAGLVGSFVFFLGVLLIVPYIKSILSPDISGFQDMSCKQGTKPCPEGYFCEQATCVPILPKYNVNEVQPGGY
jgi:hypothetical protein